MFACTTNLNCRACSKAFFAQQVRNLVLSPSLFKEETFSHAKASPIPLRRSELIQELCKSHIKTGDPVAVGPGLQSWASKFIGASHILESFLLLEHNKEAKKLLYKFRSIDPDRPERCTTSVGVKYQKVDDFKDDLHSLEELCFMTHFAYVLKEAGYDEVPEEIVEKCLKTKHIYENIELEVDYKKYVFARFWVRGRKEVEENSTDSSTALKSILGDEDAKRVLHERVLVASRSKNSSNMILKGFKDVPVDHFEALLPEAKVHIPRSRRWFLNFFLTATGITAFFNVGMSILTDFKLDVVWMLVLFSGLIAYRTMALYKSQRQKYILEWKKLLYFKSTANNSGLVLDVINKAHERSVKKALLVYGTALRLTQNVPTITETELTKAACHWLSDISKYDVTEDTIDILSSFSLLESLGILYVNSQDHEGEETRFRVQTPEVACNQLLIKVKAIAAA
ncbi:unnamed protein product [Clavelina lepadiformis]|uniref:Transmembrane protein n=1 Tax=Clavelina lepadiformis TaxID=159417 RepID=A0ABP0F8N8_CLALP